MKMNTIGNNGGCDDLGKKTRIAQIIQHLHLELHTVNLRTVTRAGEFEGPKHRFYSVYKHRSVLK